MVVSLFAYRRPEKLLLLRKALSKQQIEKIYIFCDGVNRQEHAESVNSTRKVARSFADEFSTEVIERSVNIGLNQNLLSGIDYTLSRHEFAIFLEDDVLPTEAFFKFVRQAQSRYQREENIFSISAFHPVRSEFILSDVFLSRRFFCWG